MTIHHMKTVQAQLFFFPRVGAGVFFSCRPVEGPLEQELPSRPGEAGPVFVRLEHLGDHVLQPGRPLLQGALLL